MERLKGCLIQHKGGYTLFCSFMPGAVQRFMKHRQDGSHLDLKHILIKHIQLTPRDIFELFLSLHYA